MEQTCLLACHHQLGAIWGLVRHNVAAAIAVVAIDELPPFFHSFIFILILVFILNLYPQLHS